MALTPTRSRKGSPVQNRRAADSPLRAAGDADSQFFACAYSGRQAFPYRLTCDPVANLRLGFCDRCTVPRSHAQPACMHVQARAAEEFASGSASGKTRYPKARTARFRATGTCVSTVGGTYRQPGRALYSAPLTHAPRKISPSRCAIPTIGHRRIPDARGIRPFAPPVNPHLIDRSAAKTDGEGTPEKPHRNLRGFKNPNVLRYLSANCECTGLWRTPRKTSPFACKHSYDNRVSGPEKPHLCRKKACTDSITIQYWRAFQPKWIPTTPVKSHL